MNEKNMFNYVNYVNQLLPRLTVLLSFASLINPYFHAKNIFCPDVNVLSNVDEDRMNIWGFIHGNSVVSIIVDLLDATF